MDTFGCDKCGKIFKTKSNNNTKTGKPKRIY